MAENIDIIVSLVDKASAELGTITEKLGGIGNIAKTVGASFTVVGAAITALSGVAVNSASNLNESINAVNVVFGEAAQTIHNFGITAAESAGLSQTAFNQAVTPIGSMLQNMGVSADDAAEASVRLAQRAGDMASVFNTDLSSALTAIQAGLRGEADPLERFGVGLSETAVKAHAVEMGLIGVNEEMDAQTKVTARLDLFFRQTNKIAGDFTNTSDGLANRTRILKAELENLSAQIGGVLLPIVEKIVNSLTPLVDKIQEWIENNPRLFEAIVIVTAALGALMVVLGPILVAFGMLAVLSTAIGVALFPLTLTILGIILVIGLLAAAGVLIIANWDAIKAKATEVWDAVKAKFEEFKAKVNEVVDNVKTKFTELGEKVTGVFDAIKTTIESAWNFVKDVTTFAVALIVGLVVGAFDLMGVDIVEIFTTIKTTLLAWWAELQEMFTSALAALQALWTTVWTAISGFVKTQWLAITNSFKQAQTDITNVFMPWIESLKSAWSAMWGAVSAAATAAWETAKSVVKAGINWIISRVNDLINAINKIAKAGAGVIGVSAPQISTIPLLAKGGIITQSGTAIVGEAGPEAIHLPRGASVRPLDGSGGGVTIVINNPQVWADEDVVEKIGNPLIQVLKQHMAIT